MKKLLSIILPLLATSYIYGQNTVWPSPSSNSNVGIGTTTPGLKLEVNGVTGGPASSGANQTGIVRLSNGSLVSVLDIGAFGPAPYSLWLQATDATNLADTHPISLNPNGGNIGIGTASPLAKLVVSNIGVQSLEFGYSAYLNANYLESINRSINAGMDLVLYTNNSSAQRFYTNSNERMRIDPSGNVGIGTTRPNKTLTVNGTVYATEVLVDPNVPAPDYVFDKGYELSKLQDIKTYINQNHHLPEIPSAAEVAKNGINLGEMNTKLLKKIEELTLYLIEKDKQDQKKEALLRSQQSRLNRLEKQLKAIKTSGN